MCRHTTVHLESDYFFINCSKCVHKITLSFLLSVLCCNICDFIRTPYDSDSNNHSLWELPHATYCIKCPRLLFHLLGLCFFVPFPPPGLSCLLEQNQRRVCGFWRHASCSKGHRQQARELVTGPARLVHQTAERHKENPSLKKCWKASETVHMSSHYSWVMFDILCENQKEKNKLSCNSIFYIFLCQDASPAGIDKGKALAGRLIISHHEKTRFPFT